MSVTPTDVEKEVTNIDIIVSKSDETGDITYANPIFYKIAGYEKVELFGKPHSIIRHPDMPRIIFKYLWDNLEAGKDVKAFVKNLRKDGGFYWVLAFVRVAKNPDGSFRNYVSTRRGASKSARVVIEPLYKKLLEAEVDGGMEASGSLLGEFLKENGIKPDSFNDAMQALQDS